jgi:hypothetical protein
MRFTPTTAQLELFAELQTARMPLAGIAARLGVDPAVLKAWQARLATARGYVEPIPSTAEILSKMLPGDARREDKARVIADRIFEGIATKEEKK